MNSITREQFLNPVLAAMQNAEEMGGPEGTEYIDLMSAIATEAITRLQNAATVGFGPTKTEPPGVNGLGAVETGIAAYGFEIVQTGGGCTALQRIDEIDEFESREILITQFDDACAPTTYDEMVEVGVYLRYQDNEVEIIHEVTFNNLNEAYGWIAAEFSPER